MIMEHISTLGNAMAAQRYCYREADSTVVEGSQLWQSEDSE